MPTDVFKIRTQLFAKRGKCPRYFIALALAMTHVIACLAISHDVNRNALQPQRKRVVHRRGSDNRPCVGMLRLV